MPTRHGCWLDAARDIPDPAFTDAQWRVLGAQLMTLKLAVAAQLRLRFSDTGEIDFIETLPSARRRRWAMPDDPGELLLKLDASIRHLLIDVPGHQPDAAGPVEHADLGLAGRDGRSLFLVGDPMQSIYRFRKAEVRLFLQVKEEGVGLLQPEFLNLTDNFRSQAGVVNWVNRSFVGLMPRAATIRSRAPSPTARASSGLHDALPGTAVEFHPAWSRATPRPPEQQAEDIAVTLVRQALKEHKGSKHPVVVLVRAAIWAT